jgi:hypothetical protein
MADQQLRVLVETTPKRAYASALDWPGLARSGRNEAAALDALRDALPRYRSVLERAGLGGPTFDVPRLAVLEVVERLEGDASTAFGVPARIGDADRRPVDGGEAAALAGIVRAAWQAFDATAAAAPEELRKGPRGGGRNTSKVVEHVRLADEAYAASIGIKARGLDVDALRDAVLEVLGLPSDGSPIAGKRWPPRYAARRIAWHALDHAWEIEDRSTPA